MRRFHMHLRRGQSLVEDVEGVELDSIEEARAEALRNARAILAADVEKGSFDLAGQIIVSDEFGVPVAIVNFAEALRSSGRPII